MARRRGYARRQPGDDPNDPASRLLQEQAERFQTMRRQPGGSEKWVGHVVKVGFGTNHPQIAREWMFVRVEAVEGDKLGGHLLNQPRFVRGLNNGDRVAFSAEDICGVAE